jgi:hypothetical protein
MTQKESVYPKRPVRAVVITFVALLVFVGVFIPFDEVLQETWPFAFCYCLFLAIASVGLMRLGRIAIVTLLPAAAVAMAPGIIGFVMAFRSESYEFLYWMKTSLYLFYAVGIWGIYLVVRGWFLYFKQPHEVV